MYITHALRHLRPEWRLSVATLVIASCVTLTLAITGTAPATATSGASPVIQPNMLATTVGTANTKSIRAKAAVSGWVKRDLYANLPACRTAAEIGLIQGRWTVAACVSESSFFRLYTYTP